MTAELRIDEILSALQHHGVDFVLIGGIALAAHGVIRGTKDVDIVPDPSPANLARLAGLLRAIDAHVDVRDMDPSELGIEPDADGLALGGNWVLNTTLGRLDVLQDVAGVEGFDSLRPGAVEADIPGVPGPVLCPAYEDVVAMKRAAGRDVDLMDLDDLRRARGEAD